jgi:hypothetical protein
MPGIDTAYRYGYGSGILMRILPDPDTVRIHQTVENPISYGKVHIINRGINFLKGTNFKKVIFDTSVTQNYKKKHITWTAMIQMEFEPFGLLTSRSARTTEVCILLL